MGLFGGSSNESVTKIKVNYDGKQAERGLAALQKTATAVFGAIGVKMVLQYTNELAKLGNQSEVVAKNFNNFAKQRNRETDEMMGKLKSATMNMVQDLELQQKAMQAMIGGVEFDDIITAMEYVTKFAAATGTDVNVKMQSVMTGFARKSAMFLDDVGIQVMGSKDVVGDAVDQMKAKMGQFATSEDDAYVKAAQLNAELENQKAVLGRDLQPIYSATLTFLQGMAKAAGALTQATSLYAKILGTLQGGGSLEDVKVERTIEAANKMEDKSKALAYLQDQMNKKQAESIPIAREIAKLQEKDKNSVFWNHKAEILRLEEKLFSINKQNLQYEKAIAAIRGGGIKGPAVEPNAQKGPTEEEVKKRQTLLEMIDADELDARKKAAEEMIDLEKYKADETEWVFQQGLTKRLALQASADSIQENLLSQSAEGRKQLLYKEFLESYLILEEAGVSTVKLEEWVQAEMTKIDEEEAQKRIDIHDKETQQKISASKNMVALQSALVSSMSALSDGAAKKEIDNLDKKALGEKRYEKEKSKILQEAEARNKAFARMQQAVIIAETINNALAAGVGAAKDTFGGPIIRGLAMGSMIAAGMLQVAKIQQQHFQRGYLGEATRTRKADDINAMIGANEAVIPGPQYAMHEEDIKAIVNNTANTANGLRKIKGGGVVNNFYGLSETQVADITRDQERRNYTGRPL